MDKTKEYIKMCKEAKEIQDIYNMFHQKPYLISDLFSVSNGTLITFSTQPRGLIDKQYEIVWLPRQDQLQEMLDCETYELLDMCSESDGIMWQALHDYASSMEQLWLAFVMKEKYNKIWNGDIWQ